MSNATSIKFDPVTIRLIAVFCALVVVAALISPYFFTVGNLANIARQAAAVAVVAVGMTFIIMTGGIDLSVGAIVALSSAVIAKFDGNLGLMLLVGLGTGTVAGAVNGILVTIGGISPFIATLAMLAVARGLALVVSDARPVLLNDPAFNNIGNGDVLGIPIIIVIPLVVFAVAYLFQNRAVLGRQIIAVGSNPEASRLSGVAVGLVLGFVYALSGLLAGLSAIIISARTSTGSPIHGQNYELDAIAAVVIGGTRLSGGRGSVFGTLIGVLIIGIITNILNLLNVSPNLQGVVKGGIIAAAVLLQRIGERRA